MDINWLLYLGIWLFMSKALITGISGFVGPYLKVELEKNGYTVFGLDRNKNRHSEQGRRGDQVEKSHAIFQCDLLDKKSVAKIFGELKPNFIFHLAGFSSVEKSWKQPELCQKINIEGTRNLLDAVIEAKINPRILIVSSAEVYGNPKKLPLSETSPINPQNPYAKSRVAQEKLLQNYKNLDWIVSRSFNHTGPRQPAQFVIPEFAKQLAQIKKGLQKPVIKVGNLETKRDFSDVRDVVRAYRLLLEKGKKHEIYNVCSGKAYKINDLLNTMISQIDIDVKIEIDKSKFRPQDIKELRGDNSKIKELGFKNSILIDKTLKDSLKWWINNQKC